MHIYILTIVFILSCLFTLYGIYLIIIKCKRYEGNTFAIIEKIGVSNASSYANSGKYYMVYHYSVDGVKYQCTEEIPHMSEMFSKDAQIQIKYDVRNHKKSYYDYDYIEKRRVLFGIVFLLGGLLIAFCVGAALLPNVLFLVVRLTKR